MKWFLGAICFFGIPFIMQTNEFEKDFEEYTKTCSKKNTDVCYNAALVYEERGDFKQALHYHTKACNYKEPIACAALGRYYSEGTGVAKKKKKASEYYKRACKFGKEQFNSDEWCLYDTEQANASEKDSEEYAKSCSKHNAEACFKAAFAYLEQGDSKKTFAYLEKACNYKEPIACATIGVFYSEGTGVAQDEKKASEYYNRACKLGKEQFNSDEWCF